RYRVLKEKGRIHAKQFTVGVYFGNTLIARGCGSHKRFAEDDAARDALCLKGWVSPSPSTG
ncbi:MAG: putative dsRNA-binding protein, partial [Nitrososphaera sp.]|nr:putative dsRNA-binding protein [Nitrososphaera sp.]